MANRCSTSTSRQLMSHPTKQEKSPGIIMIIEAEELAGNIHSFNQVSRRLEEALQEEGFNVVSSGGLGEGKAGIIFAKEGHVTVRLWPEYHYCALDVHLWSSFEKHRAVQQALVAALGGKSEGKHTSSYRIVAGGMFGVSTWQMDEMNRGPVYLHAKPVSACNSTDNTEMVSPIDPAKPVMPSVSAAMNSFLEASISSIIGVANPRVAVLCGPQSFLCSTMEIAKEMDQIGSVYAIYACPDLVENIEHFFEDQIFECEKQVHKSFHYAAAEGKADAIVIDSSAPFPMGQVVLRLLASSRNVAEWLNKDFMVLSPMVKGKVLSETQSWQMNFLLSLKQNVFPDDDDKDRRVFIAEVLLSDFPLDTRAAGNTPGLRGMSFFSRGRKGFVNRLVNVSKSWEQHIGLGATISKIRCGEPWFQYNWDPSLVGTPKHYNQTDALEQWKSQRSLGLQSILQFDAQQHEKIILSADKVYVALNHTVSSLLGKCLADDQASNVKDMDVQIEWHDSRESGDGYALAAFWATGNAVAIWDGRFHIDLNLFTVEERIEYADLFEQEFGAATGLKRTLRDQQPRGTGELPYWIGIEVCSLFSYEPPATVALCPIKAGWLTFPVIDKDMHLIGSSCKPAAFDVSFSRLHTYRTARELLRDLQYGKILGTIEESMKAKTILNVFNHSCPFLLFVFLVSFH